jgi:5-methylthioadenosine/S-adenosylhomocysteine deaminase
MRSRSIDRRAVLAAAASIGASTLMRDDAAAQSATTGQGAVGTLPAPGEFVVRGAHVLSLDPKIGDLPTGDVHVRDGAIVAVGANVDAGGAEVIDGRGKICMPGFVETHWHHWTSLFRPIIGNDVPERTYFPVTSRLAPHMTADDSYNSVRLGLAEALSAGVTTTHNWAHNIRSPAHADAELRAMADTGIRGRFSYGTPQGAPNDQPMDLADLARVKRDWIKNDGMLTLGIASRNVGDGTNPLRGNISVEMAKKDWGGARELGLTITMHTSGASPVKLLNDSGLLGPDLELVHPLLTTAEERAMMKEKGVCYSTSPVGESQRPASAGVIQLGELLQDGVKASLSIDHTTNYNCDCFGCMRMAYSLHKNRLGNKIPLTSKRMVELATLDGARDLGVADRVGSLTPGKRADLILIRTTDINMTPMGDPYEALVSLAQPSNVDTTIVDGRVLYRGGRHTALDHKQIVANASKSLADIRARAKWP